MKKLLLDENLPRQLSRQFSSEFDVTSVPDLGWQSKTNGELLTSMRDAGFECLITADRNLQHQQNLEKYKIKIVLLQTFDTRLKYLLKFVDEIESSIRAQPIESVLLIDLRGR